MSIDVKGIDRLMNKLNKLDNIKGINAVESVVPTIELALKAGASWAPNSVQYIRKCEIREYPRAYFVDIGLRNDEVDFDLWKHLWFHNWGYNQYYYGHKTGKYTIVHSMWFNNALNNIGDVAINKIKSELRVEIKKCLEAG